MKTAILWKRSFFGGLGALLICLGGTVCGAQEAGGAEADEEWYAWSIRSYRVPGDLLATGFVSEEKGQLNLPEIPAGDAGAEEIQDFIKGSSAVLGEFFKQQGITLPEGSLALFDVEQETLAVRTTGALHGLIGVLMNDYLQRVPKMLAFRLDVLEAETGEVLKMMDEAVGAADHGALLERLEAQVGAGNGRFLGSGRIDTRSGERVKIDAVTDSGFGTDFAIDEKGSGGASGRDTREIGMLFEIDPVLGTDNATIDINFVPEFSLAPPTVRQVPVGSLGGKRVEVPVTDFHTARILTALTVLDGQCRLLGVWQAQGEAAEGRQVVAFLTGKVVYLMAAESAVALTWLNEQGEKVAATPPKVKPEGVRDPQMIVQHFRIPPDFFSSGGDPDKARAPVDPFAPPAGEPTFQIKATALEILRAQGIPFPEGSSANFNPATGGLIVRNSPKNMELVEDLFATLGPECSPLVRLLLHIVQADGSTLRRLDRAAMGQADHAGMWREIEKEMAAGRASLVRTAWIETRNGQRAKSSAATEYVYATGTRIGDGGKISAEGGKEQLGATAIANGGGGPLRILPEFNVEEVGLVWEIDPVVGNDGVTIDLNTAFSVDTAPPTERFKAPANDELLWRVDSPEVDFHKSTVSTALTTRSGMKRLLGLWKPKGSPEMEGADILQAAFIEARIVQVE